MLSFNLKGGVLTLALAASSEGIRTKMLQACLTKAEVPASFPSSPNFSQLAEPYNLRLPYQPAAIALPTTPQQVSGAILCAGNSIKVQARSGGHSYAAFGLGGQNGSLVIDLEAFNKISVDANGIASVGAGVRLGNLALGIYDQHKRALPHGVCPQVGIGGHASHGGYWYSSRGWGLTMDTIVGLDAVLADGRIIYASENSHSHIYWALRGAAESIGIMTTFHFKTQPEPNSIVNWSYIIPASSPTVAADAFAYIQDFVLNASIIDDKIGLGLSPGASSFEIRGIYRGDQDYFSSKIAPELLRGLPTPSSSSYVKTMEWISSLEDLWGGPLAQPLTGDHGHDNFYAKSVIVPEASPLTMSSLTSYFHHLSSNLTKSYPALWFSEINLLGGPGSAVNNPPPAAANAAYSERGALWVVQHYSENPSAAQGGAKAAIDFVSGLNAAMETPMPETRFGGYINYADPELSARQAHALYYSQEVYERLVRIKRAVDPKNIFYNPQAVGA